MLLSNSIQSVPFYCNVCSLGPPDSGITGKHIIYKISFSLIYYTIEHSDIYFWLYVYNENTFMNFKQKAKKALCFDCLLISML